MKFKIMPFELPALDCDDFQKEFHSFYTRNSASVIFDTDESMRQVRYLIKKIISKSSGFTIDNFLNGEIIKQKDKNDDLWAEEWMACIAHALFVFVPLCDRIDWIAKVLNRTNQQVISLLGLHYKLQADPHKDWYFDLTLEVKSDVEDFFIPFYAVDHTHEYEITEATATEEPPHVTIPTETYIIEGSEVADAPTREEEITSILAATDALCETKPIGQEEEQPSLTQEHILSIRPKVLSIISNTTEITMPEIRDIILRDFDKSLYQKVKYQITTSLASLKSAKVISSALREGNNFISYFLTTDSEPAPNTPATTPQEPVGETQDIESAVLSTIKANNGISAGDIAKLLLPFFKPSHTNNEQEQLLELKSTVKNNISFLRNQSRIRSEMKNDTKLYYPA